MTLADYIKIFTQFFRNQNPAAGAHQERGYTMPAAEFAGAVKIYRDFIHVASFAIAQRGRLLQGIDEPYQMRLLPAALPVWVVHNESTLEEAHIVEDCLIDLGYEVTRTDRAGRLRCRFAELDVKIAHFAVNASPSAIHLRRGAAHDRLTAEGVIELLCQPAALFF